LGRFLAVLNNQPAPLVPDPKRDDRIEQELTERGI
jgi:hypothetical protein